MSVVGLPLQLRHREIYGASPLLFTNLDRIEKLISIGVEEHAVELTNILLWIAKNYPEVLEDEYNMIKSSEPNGSFKCLNFRSSWEFTDEIVPTDALVTLLNSKFCRYLKAFCGYVNPQILINLPYPLCVMNITLGKHSDVSLLISELNLRYGIAKCTIRERYQREEVSISIHIKCGELDLEAFSRLPNIHPTLYISDVDDSNAAWVVQATEALAPRDATARHDCEISNSGIATLRLPRSNLTKDGVEGIVKGFCDIDLNFSALCISSPYIGEGGRTLTCTDNNMSSADEVASRFTKMFKDRFNSCGNVFFRDDKELCFTEYNYKSEDYVPSDDEDSWNEHYSNSDDDSEL